MTEYVAALEKHYVHSRVVFAALHRRYGALPCDVRPEDEVRAQGALDALREMHADTGERP